MTRQRLIFLLVSALVVLPLVAGTLLAAGKGEVDDGDSLFKYLTVFTEVLTRVRENYVDAPDLQRLLAGALDGTTDALDPFSLYVPAEAAAGYLAARTIGSSHSGLLLLKEHGVLYVAGVAAGGPASKAGVRLGDVVAEIGGENTHVMPVWKAEQMLAGAPGSVVDLKVIRFDEMKHVPLTLGTFASSPPSLVDRQGIAVLRLADFDATTPQAAESVLQSAKASGYNKLVLDLRGNADLDVEPAFSVAGLFATGEIGSLRSRGRAIATYRGLEQPVWSGRMVVLVDRGTLGASEALAAVLQQKAGARLVGARSFGHSGRQQLAELPSGGRLVYTDAFYAGPDGKLLDQALLPDERVEEEFFEREKEPASAVDKVLDRAIGLLLAAEEPVKKVA